MWFLSFDCATKTFAFSLSRVDLDAFRSQREALSRRVACYRELMTRPLSDEALAELGAAVRADEAASAEWIVLVDGETTNLCPGIPDAEISAVKRITALVAYVDRRIRPLLVGCEGLQVLIEYQMGQNTPALAVSNALIALFAAYPVTIVDPRDKNRIATCEAGRYHHFTAKYETTYSANKAHAKFNFDHIERTFGTKIPPSHARGHIADSFMQVLGHLIVPKATSRERF